MNKQDKKKLFGLIPVSGLKGWDLVCLHFALPFVALIFNESLMFFLLHMVTGLHLLWHMCRKLCAVGRMAHLDPLICMKEVCQTPLIKHSKRHYAFHSISRVFHHTQNARTHTHTHWGVVGGEGKGAHAFQLIRKRETLVS